jgi:hypothetical protein
MNKFLITIFCWCSTFTSLSQGLVLFSNTPETLVWNSVGGNVTPINGPVGSYYFALLISSHPWGPFGFPDVYATNVVTESGGQFNGGTVLVPGWQPGTTMFYMVAGWDGFLGSTFQPSWLSGPAYANGSFYFSEVGSGIAGGGPQNLPPLPLFGGTGITSGFHLNVMDDWIPRLPVAPIIKINPAPAGVLLTWPSGTLQQADEGTGPFIALTNASSPYMITNGSPRKFYRLGP